jgi:hypothetical protein
VDERNVHPADKADALRLADDRRERADEERAFFLAELERGEVGRRRDRVAGGVGRDRVVNAGERDVRILLREAGQVIGEDEPHTDDQIHPLGGEQPESRLAVRSLARLDEPHVRAELAHRALRAGIRAVVERLVASSADVEDHPDLEVTLGDRLRRAAGRDEEQGDVDDEQDGDGDDELPHGHEDSSGATATARSKAREERSGG